MPANFVLPKLIKRPSSVVPDAGHVPSPVIGSQETPENEEEKESGQLKPDGVAQTSRVAEVSTPQTRTAEVHGLLGGWDKGEPSTDALSKTPSTERRGDGGTGEQVHTAEPATSEGAAGQKAQKTWDAKRWVKQNDFLAGAFREKQSLPFKNRQALSEGSKNLTTWEGRERRERQTLNVMYLAHHYGKGHQEVNANYPAFRRKYASEVMRKSDATDDELFLDVRVMYAVEGSLFEEATASGYLDEATGQGFARRLNKLRQLNGWKVEDEEKYRKQFEAARQAMVNHLSPYRSTINSTVLDLQRLMGAKDGKGEDWDVLAKRLMDVPAAIRPMVLEAVVRNGESAEEKNGLQKTGENLWRGTEALITALSNRHERSVVERALKLIENPDTLVFSHYTIDDIHRYAKGISSSSEDGTWVVHGVNKLFGSGRSITAEERAELKRRFENELGVGEMAVTLKGIADEVIDPARSDNAVVQGFYSFVRSLPQIAAVATPYVWPGGLVMVNAQHGEEDYHLYRRNHPDLPREQAQMLADISAPLKTFTNAFADRFMLRTLPSLSKLARQPTTTWVNGLKQSLKGAPAAGALELVTENAQTLTPYAVQEVVKALKADIPDAPWEQALADLKAGQGELISTVVWSTLILRGVAGIRDVRSYRNQAKHPLLMEAVGFSEAAAAKISKSALSDDWDQVEVLMRDEYANGRVETHGANLLRQREAATKLLQDEAKRRGVAISELEKIKALPVLSRTKDGGYQLAFDDGSKGTYRDAEEAVTAMRDWAGHRGMRMTEEMREVFAKVQGDMEAGREVALQFSPEQMMAQRAVETGLATKKQMQERGQAGEALLGNAVMGGMGTDPVNGKGSGTGNANLGVGSDADFGATSLDTASYGVSGEGSSEGRVAEDGDYEATLHMAQAMAPEAADAEVAGQILGISRTAFKEGVARTTIRLYQGATPLTLIEEKLEGDASVMMRDPSKRAWLLEALRDVERKTGSTLFRTPDDAQVTDGDIKEAWSHLGQGYFVGRSKKGDDQMLASWKQKGFRQVYADIMQSKAGPAMQAYGTFFRSVWRRGAELNGMRRVGTLDADLEGALRRSLGMGEMSDSSRAVQSDSITGASQESDPVVVQTMDAVSTTFSMLGGEGDAAMPKQTPLDRANDFLRREVVNKPLTTLDGLTATVSNASASKMTSGSAVKKSASPEAHLAAISKFSELYRSGRITETKPDRNLDPNIKAIHRVTATMALDDKRHTVKFTVKEFARTDQSNRIYSIEALEIEDASEGKRVDSTVSQGSPTSTPQSEARQDSNIKASEDQSLSLIPDGQAKGDGGVDPRILKAFGADAKLDSNGLPIPPRTLADNDPLLQPTIDKKTVILDEDHVLVRNGMLKAGMEISRKQLRQAIVSFFMNSSKPVPDGTKPVVTAMGGGGGAGKSRMLSTLEASGLAGLAGAAKVNPDDIAEIIPEYRQIVESGDSRAAETVYREATQISGVLMDTLLTLPPAQRRNIIYDSTLSRRDSALRHFSKWRGAGYGVNLVGITLDPKEATIRAAVRAKQEGRWVPYERIAEAHQGFNGSVKEYFGLVDAAYLYESVFDHSPELVARKSGLNSSIEVVLPKLWYIVEERGQSNESGRSHKEN